ncbi:MAG: prenyltransferase, partial [Peptococcaceae bacterium]|nr:prenyltransferase [Peptococcaceae bacterium]
LLLAVAGMFGVGFAHSGFNLFDDYFDSKNGAVKRRQEMQDGGMRARMGKCSYLAAGGVTLADTRRVATFFIGLGLLLGALILAIRGWEVLLFAGVTLVLGLAYAGSPLRLSYHGLGELLVGVVLGPLVVTAAYFVVCGRIDALAVWVSIPIGLLVANILNAHAIMDFGADKAAGRTTFAILLGSEKAGFAASVVMVVLAYAAVVAGVTLGSLPLFSLAVFLTLPVAMTFIRLLYQYVQGDASALEPRKWMGPFDHWETVKERGTDWFMCRWFLSRNLVMFAVLCLALAGLTPWYL